MPLGVRAFVSVGAYRTHVYSLPLGQKISLNFKSVLLKAIYNSNWPHNKLWMFNIPVNISRTPLKMRPCAVSPNDSFTITFIIIHLNNFIKIRLSVRLTI